MFTVQQIKAAHAKVKSGADFPAYVNEIKKLGLIRYEFMVSDGSTIYHGENGYQVSAAGIYPLKKINKNADTKALKQTIAEHQQGKTDFLTVCSLVADNGVEKWIVDTQAMLCTYYNTAGEEILAEPIPQTGY